MIDDLRSMNRSIVELWLGKLDRDQESYLEFAPVCIATPAHSPTEVAQLLSRLRSESWNRKAVGELNYRYLQLARLAAHDQTDVGIEMLIRLNVSLKQAELLRHLSDADIALLAMGSAGPMMRFAPLTFRRGVNLHRQAGKHHATALVAAPQGDEESRS